MTATEQAVRPAAQPIPSATVLVLRDGAAGLEVFMLVRNRVVDFASGALVFPGGKVDRRDKDPAWQSLAPVKASHPELSYWVAALRETFEETGLLLAERQNGGGLIDAAAAIALTAASQKAVAEGKQGFETLLAAEGLQLTTERMLPFAHWITPATMPKRFDTHFFLAEAPAGQIAVHDGGETVESMWISPRQALMDADAGKRVLVPATALNLEKLGKAASVQDAFSQARASRIVPVTPTVARAEGGVRISIPQDAGYETTSVFVPRATPA